MSHKNGYIGLLVQHWLALLSPWLDVHLNWLNCFCFIVLVGRPRFILIDCIILCSHFQMSQGVYVNSFFPHKSRLWNSMYTGCFPLTYDLNSFKSRINRHLLFKVISKQLPCLFLIFFFFFSL